jgi:hypothetical protein
MRCICNMPAYSSRRKIKSRRGETGEPLVLQPPAIQSVAAGTGQLTVNYSLVTNGTYYEIWRATSSGGTYSKRSVDGAEIDGTFVDNVSSNGPWYYKVRAVNVTGGTTTFSDYSSIVSGVLPTTGSGSDAIVPGTLTFFPGFESAGVELTFTGDHAWTGEADLSYRYSTDGGDTWSDWKSTPPMINQRQIIDRNSWSQDMASLSGASITSATATTMVVSKEWVGVLTGRYNGWRMEIVAGTGAGQVRTVDTFVGKVPTDNFGTFTVTEAWDVTPNTTSRFICQHPTNDRIFAQNIMWLPDGADVEVEITLAHDDGVDGANPVTGSFSCKDSDDYTARGSLVPTHYVTTTGSDAAAGTIGAPWATVGKAVSHFNTNGGNMVVRFGPGRYHCRHQYVTHPTGKLTLMAQNAAVDDDVLELADMADATIFYYGVTTGPVGSGADIEGANVWTKIPGGTRVGPITGTTAPDEFWTYTPTIYQQATGGSRAVTPTTTKGVSYIGTSPDLLSKPRVIGMATCSPIGRLNSTSIIATEPNHVEFMNQNNLYNHYAFPSPDAAGKPTNKVILRLPAYAVDETDTPVTDPNEVIITMCPEVVPLLAAGITADLSATSLPVGGSTFRLSGIRMDGYSVGVQATSTAAYHMYDQCLFVGSHFPIRWSAIEQPSVQWGNNHLVHKCSFWEYSLRAQPEEDADVQQLIPRMSIKNTSKFTHGGVIHTKGKNLKEHETCAIKGEGGAQNICIRHSKFDGYFNGPNAYNPNDFSRYVSAGPEFYGNRFYNCSDDCIEYENVAFLARIFHNRAEHVGVFITRAKGEWGPMTVSRNQVWQLTVEEVAVPTDGITQEKLTALFFKTDGSEFPPGTVYCTNNTLISPRNSLSLTPETWGRFWHLTNDGSPGHRANLLYMNNLIFCCGQIITGGERKIGRILTSSRGEGTEENNNFMASRRGTRYIGGGNNDPHLTSIDEWRDITENGLSNGANTNVKVDTTSFDLDDIAFIDTLVVNSTTGDLSYSAAGITQLVGRGLVIPNLTAYDADPDIGAGDLVDAMGWVE